MCCFAVYKSTPATVRLVAPGCAKRMLRDDLVRVSRFHARTGVRYARRDVLFRARMLQIQRVLVCALRTAWPHLATGSCCSAPL
jgi:hypothetical protein